MSTPWRVWAGTRPKWCTPPLTRASHGIDAAIAWLAERQHGLVALAQLLLIGMSRRAVTHRAERGALHRIHRSVFAVGQPMLTQHGHFMAAVLACGPGTALSHQSAAALHGLRESASAWIDVTVPGRAGQNIAGIRAHRSRTLTSDLIVYVAGIPCTSVERTLIDLAEVVSPQKVRTAMNEAEVRRVFDRTKIEDVLKQTNGRRGATIVEAILSDHDVPSGLTRKELEERFLLLCRSSHLPQPEVNQWVASSEADGYEVDFLWRTDRLIVETDGWETHRTRQAFERDRERDQRLALKGFRVLRFTWRQVLNEPGRVQNTLAALLRAAA